MGSGDDSRRDHGIQPHQSQYILSGGWRESSFQHDEDGCAPEILYKDYPLCLGLICNERKRRAFLEHNGRKQINSTKSTDGWIKTILLWEARALDKIIFPWILLTLNAVFWTVFAESYFETPYGDPRSWDFFVGIVLNTSLSFLLVFRLNRAAERFWLARQTWGKIVAIGRTIVSGVLVHGRHDPNNRDDVIRWVAAFCIATMQFIRSIPAIAPESLDGILTPEQIHLMQLAPHPPIHATCHARMAVRDLFEITADTPPSLAHLYAQHMTIFETSLNNILDQAGTMERIRSTPLPVVYVSHLRTFLLIFLLIQPYVWQPSWGWFTIPIVALSAFALLGLEGASQEVEAPFSKDRPNHLNMDAYCLLLLSNIQQMVTHAAQEELLASDKWDGRCSVPASVPEEA